MSLWRIVNNYTDIMALLRMYWHICFNQCLNYGDSNANPGGMASPYEVP